MTSPESMPVRRADRGDHRAPVLVRREELEAERLHSRARGAAEPDMPVEDSFETLLEHEAERDVEPADERDRQRDGRVERLLRLARPLPVEVEARRRPGRRQRVLGDGGERQAPAGDMSAFCEPGDDDVEAPRVGLARDRAEARDRVDDDERVRLLRRGRERRTSATTPVEVSDCTSQTAFASCSRSRARRSSASGVSPQA